ncbi:HRDC domain-containing protein [Nocardioides houyundeii]|uniref:HRDC domain-containing protein n=1 Tax=Nocardioides houyundeii TaxID=2045452 RepID=UPI000C765F33|nr:HRDC domain-containing protein [Nocardioides houyundeii]
MTSTPDDEALTTGASPEGDAEPAPPVPLLTLSGGIPDIVDTPAALAKACAALAAATGPVAIDAERASGYRYSSRAYLIQLRRGDSGTWLIDPIPFGSDLPELAEALGTEEWILHAATQDLPCLREVGLTPTSIFDTELAGRLLGYHRVGLATLVEEIVGLRMRKEHSAADWSTRPLPRPWLEYAALDVEVLVDLRDHMAAELVEQGKDEWARQEFTHLLDFQPAVRVEPWRRTSGMQRLRGRRQLAAVRALWETRDDLARQRDVTPGRIIPDAAIIAAATAMPTDRGALLATRGFHGRGAERYASRWTAALAEAAQLPEDQLPQRSPRGDGPPHPRTWAEREPAADRRFKAARAATLALAEANHLPVENLITPDYVRRAMWAPPATRDEQELADQLAEQLRSYGARPWQVELVTPPLVDAVLVGDQPVEEEPDDLGLLGDPADADAE